MRKLRAIVCVMAVVVGLSTAAFGQPTPPAPPYVDYQGTGGNLLAGPFYDLTDPYDPSTRTGGPHSPVAGDSVFLRGATTTTLDGTLTASYAYVGGVEVWPMGQPNPTPQGPSTMYIVNGGSLNLPLDSTGRFLVGNYYNGTVKQSGGYVQAGRIVMGQYGYTGTDSYYQLTGGTVKTGGNFYVGFADADDVKTAKLDMSGGYIEVGDQFVVSNNEGGSVTGTVNISAGTINAINGDFHVSGGGTVNQTGGLVSVARLDWSTIGGDGVGGTYNLSGGSFLDLTQLALGIGESTHGTLNVSNGYYENRVSINIGHLGGTGVVNISGGSFIHMREPGDDVTNYRVWVGRHGGTETPNSFGHLNITGGSVSLVKNFWIGAVGSNEGKYTHSTGKVTLSQAATFRTEQLLMTGSTPAGGRVENCILEFQLANANNFDYLVSGNAQLKATFVISTVGGFTPSHDQEWKLITAGSFGSLAGHVITPDYELSIVGSDLMLKYTGVGAAHPGDANIDNAVDVGDLGILAGNWGGGPGKTWAQGDFNSDGWVDVGDLGVLAGNWGWVGGGGGTQPVPEPATLGLLALGALGMIRRRSN